MNGRFVFPNAAATLFVEERSRDALWTSARSALDDGDETLRVSTVGAVEVGLRVAPITHRGSIVGAEIRFSRIGPGAPRTARTTHPVAGWASLLESERALAVHVASGLTNRDIAFRLHLSRHTVDYHLRHVYRKLAISSRVDLTRLVIEHEGASLVQVESAMSSAAS